MSDLKKKTPFFNFLWHLLYYREKGDKRDTKQVCPKTFPPKTVDYLKKCPLMKTDQTGLVFPRFELLNCKRTTQIFVPRWVWKSRRIPMKAEMDLSHQHLEETRLKSHCRLIRKIT